MNDWTHFPVSDSSIRARLSVEPAFRDRRGWQTDPTISAGITPNSSCILINWQPDSEHKLQALGYQSSLKCLEPPTAPLLWRTYGLSKENINCIFLWASLSFCPRWQQSLHYMDWGGSLLSSEGTRLHTHRSMAVACKCLLSEGVEVMEEAMNGHTMLSVGTKKTGKANLGTDHKCN